jgi:hypothetical protein
MKINTAFNYFNKDIKMKSGMIDNRKVHDNHQQGIERVKQRRSEYNPKDCAGHDGKMGKDIPSMSNWKRGGESLTPRKA